MDRKEDI